jgi:CGNR zinc finger
VKTYYALSGTLRYYGPGFEKRWPDAPHRAFANLHLDVAALGMFTQRYGHLYFPGEWPKPNAEAIAASDERLGTALRMLFSFVPDLQQAKNMQKLLVRAWCADQGAIADIEKDIKVFPLFGATERAFGLNDPPDGFALYAEDMWNFVRAAFLLDYKNGRAKVCKNPDCPAPYFLQSRKGQEFCSHKCAVLVNVRRFRAGLTASQVKNKSRKAESKRR